MVYAYLLNGNSTENTKNDNTRAYGRTRQNAKYEWKWNISNKRTKLSLSKQKTKTIWKNICTVVGMALSAIYVLNPGCDVVFFLLFYFACEFCSHCANKHWVRFESMFVYTMLMIVFMMIYYWCTASGNLCCVRWEFRASRCSLVDLINRNKRTSGIFLCLYHNMRDSNKEKMEEITLNYAIFRKTT